ncbi:MAG: peroxiredoxin family protein [Bryobacteraceae bacterium]
MSFAALLCAGLTLSGQLLSAQNLSTSSLSGRRAPGFSLPDSKLAQHDLLDYRGHWLVIDFMQTNCPHCQALSKTLDEVKTRYGAKVAVLAIVVPPDNLGTVGKFISDYKINYPILFDSSQVAVSYFKATPQHSSIDMPHWFAIDPKGDIVRDWGQSSADTKDWVKEFDRLMSSK